ncbi:MAG: hypothetical protein ACXVPU_07000 [Bacteroidia bacterium]
MSNRSKIISLFILASTIYACRNTRTYDKVSLPQPIKYSVLQKSPVFNEKNISFSIDSMNNVLLISLKIDALKNCPFPINKLYNDTLSKTAFNFDFYYNNKIIQTDYRKIKNTLHWFNDTTATALNLSLSTDTIDLKTSNTVYLSIPFYAFHNLKKGTQTIELRMSQNVFTVEAQKIKNKDSYDYVHLYETKPILNAKLRFNINLPPIYKTIIYGLGITLQNDSAWSPAGMDNTLWNSSYPDIYWTIFFPKNEFYAQTPYEKSTAEYVGHDTFNLYHYNLNDSIGFGVYDHDFLSSDDGMGFWYGSLKDLTNHEYKRLKFDHIHIFDLKVKQAGVIN